jgi:hypothetical protein
MRVLDKDSFINICGICASPKNDLSQFNGSEFECVCGDTHIFHDRHTIHVCYDATWLNVKLVVTCPESVQHLTLLETRLNVGVFPDGFVALAGYIAGNKDYSNCSDEYFDTLNAEPWIQALWEWEDINGFSFLPRNKYDLVHLDKLSMGNFMFFDKDQKDKLDELPKEICHLDKLKHLSLGSATHPEVYITNLTKLPEALGELTLLESLCVQFNQLEKLPVTIGNLTNLKDLKLGGNKLTKLPKEIGNLTNLETLTLWSNNLPDLPSEIGKLRQLRGLDIAGNPLRKLPGEIVALTNLKKFYLNDDMLLSTSQKKWMNELKGNGCEIL